MWVETYDKQFINLDKVVSIKKELHPYSNDETDDYVLVAHFDTNANGVTKWLFRGTEEDCKYCYEALYLAFKNNFNCLTFNPERV